MCADPLGAADGVRLALVVTFLTEEVVVLRVEVASVGALHRGRFVPSTQLDAATILVTVPDRSMG